MTPERRARSTLVALALLSMAGAAVAHYALVLGAQPKLGAFVALAPLTVLLIIVLRRSRLRGPGLWLLVAAAGASILVGWDSLERHFPSVYFLEHVLTNLLLAAMFGRTLSGGSEPLCSRFARLIHGPLPPPVRLYTRQVTLAWALFFITLAAASCLLFLGGFTTAWSVLANFLTLPLIVGMFVIEYAVRLRVLRNWPQVGILEGLRAFWHHSGEDRYQAPL